MGEFDVPDHPDLEVRPSIINFFPIERISGYSKRVVPCRGGLPMEHSH
jgi:hypothetical protein